MGLLALEGKASGRCGAASAEALSFWSACSPPRPSRSMDFGWRDERTARLCSDSGCGSAGRTAYRGWGMQRRAALAGVERKGGNSTLSRQEQRFAIWQQWYGNWEGWEGRKQCV